MSILKIKEDFKMEDIEEVDLDPKHLGYNNTHNWVFI